MPFNVCDEWLSIVINDLPTSGLQIKGYLFPVF